MQSGVGRRVVGWGLALGLTLGAGRAVVALPEQCGQTTSAERRAADDRPPQRLPLATRPAGVRSTPNPSNRIPGFMANEHYFVPGFPQMAHPMIEWALETFYRDEFRPVANTVEKAFLLTGPTAYESALLDLMERIVGAYPSLRLFSLPSLAGNERRHLELGVEGDPALVDQAMDEIRGEIERRGISWTWRP